MRSLYPINDLQNNKTMFFIALFFSATISMATSVFPKSYADFIKDCDTCGCANSGGSLGTGGTLDTNFIGLRFLHQKYTSKDGIFNNAPTIEEYFNTTQVWAQIPFFQNKITLQLMLPFHFHKREYKDKTTQINGLGDVSFLLNYTALNFVNTRYRGVAKTAISNKHVIKVGAGLKLPTGKYTEKINNGINPSFQLGTGSTDVLFNLQYVYTRNAFGVNSFLNYYYKTTNDKDYKFGNQFNFNTIFFYNFKNDRQSFVPSLGVSGEFYQFNKQFGLPIRNSEGKAVFSTIGVEYTTNKITIGTLAMYPLYQKLANGTIKSKYRSSIYINYNL